jgi:hypothetical protein
VKETQWLPLIVVGLIGSAVMVFAGTLAASQEPGFSETTRDVSYYQPGGGTGLDLRKNRTSEPQGQGFDSPHLHQVSVEAAVVEAPSTSAAPALTTTTAPTAMIVDPIGQQYEYYSKGPQIVDLQTALGMDVIDGVYGPKTRKAHIAAFSSSMSAILHFYPEVMQAPTPCSHGCLPGDSHHDLPMLEELINEYFEPEDRALARQIAFCESSGKPHDIGSTSVSSALAIGWFQHLAKYWVERSEKAGFKDHDPFNGRANVGVAAWLFYSSGVHHWNPSKACWGISDA